MNVLDHFSIPYKGLKNGAHRFIFEVDDAFFATFENSYVQGGDLKVELDLDKRPDLAIAAFQVEGEVKVNCDRCLQQFERSVEGDFLLHIKTGLPDPDQDEVLFIDPETSSINFATYIYECISLLLPIAIVHEDIKDCDQEMLSRFTSNDDDDDAPQNDLWDSLKGLKFD